MSKRRKLMRLDAEAWDWRLRGACRSRDSVLFFHSDRMPRSIRDGRDAVAKALCRRCPVRPECAAYALREDEPYGVWGGFTEGERVCLRAVGWEDLADARRARVDVDRLQARLDGQRKDKATA